MSTTALHSSSDCLTWFDSFAGPSGTLRIKSVTRSCGELDCTAVTEALAALVLEQPTRFTAQYIATATAVATATAAPADGEDPTPQHFIARAASRDAALAAVNASVTRAELPAVAEGDIAVRLDAVCDGWRNGATSADAADDVPVCKNATVIRRGGSGATINVDALANRSERKVLLRAHSGVTDRVYRTFSRKQLSSGELPAVVDSEPAKPVQPPLPKPAPLAKAGSSGSSAAATTVVAAPTQPTVKPEPGLGDKRPSSDDAEAAQQVAAPVQPPKVSRPETSVPVAAPAVPPAAPKAKALGGSQMMRAFFKPKSEPAAASSPSTGDAVEVPPKPAAAASEASAPAAAPKPSDATPPKKELPATAGSAEKRKPGRPKMTDEEKAAAAEKRRQKQLEAGETTTSATVAKKGKAKFGVKSSTVKMGDGTALLDDSDDDAQVVVDDAPLRQQTSSSAAMESAAPSFDAEAHEVTLYEQELARIAAEQQQGAAGEFKLDLAGDAGNTAAPSRPAQQPAREATPAPPPVVMATVVGVTPSPSRRATATTKAATPPSGQPKLEAFVAITNSGHHDFEKRVTTDMVQIDGEYVSKDIVTFVHKSTGETLSEADFKHRFASLPTAPAAPAPAADTVGAVPLKARDDNTGNRDKPKAAKAAQPKPTGGKKKTAEAAAAGTKTLASFWGAKK